MKITTLKFIICLCIFMASSVVAHAQTGSLDSTFDSDGKLTTSFGTVDNGGRSVAIQNDGKIVVTGFSGYFSNYDFAVVRFNTNGTLDSTFDFDGKVTTDFGSTDEFGYSVAIQNDGKIVVAGSSGNGSYYDFAVVRYNSNGTLDSTFDIDGKVTTDFGSTDEYGYSVAIQNDGKIVVTGSSGIGSDYDFAVVRYNNNGTLDSTFDLDGKVKTSFGVGNDIGESVAIQSDGKIVVAGAGWSGNGPNYDFAIVRYNSNGTLDNTFDVDGKVTTSFGVANDGGRSVAIQNDGKIVVSGSSNNGSDSDFAVARFNSNGTLDTTFDVDGKVTTSFGTGDDGIASVAIQSDGKIVVAGNSDNGSDNDFAVARYNSNGTLDSTFDVDGKVTTDFGSTDEYGYSVALQNDGKIVVAGKIASGSISDFAVVRYNGDFGAGIIENTSQKNTIKTYPNPFNNELIIKEVKEKGEISIFNLMGVEMVRIQTFNTETKINTENLLPGLYFLKYTNEGKNENVKLLKL